MLKTPSILKVMAIISIALLSGCGESKTSSEMDDEQMNSENNENIVILTEIMDFQMKDTIPSGWNTFTYRNESEEVHFFLVDKYPEGKGIEDSENEVAPSFQKGMDYIDQGNMDSAMAEFGKLPEWFNDVKFVGGSGLISPGKSTTVSFHLKPGPYLMECYVKMSNGVFHSTMGMIKEFHVSEEQSNQKEPQAADVNIAISSTEGITVKDSITSGENLFKVTYKDQIVHENFVGHDVNLVKLSDVAELDTLENWMNWSVPGGLETPAPEGVVFLGGINDMLEGDVGYFYANLEPGRYALISEVPDSRQKNMFKIFNVQ